jgi:hypothetical protein
MYEALGDRDAQDEIRKQKGRHCPFLKRDPNACVSLPFDIGETGKAGEVCPNNTFDKPLDVPQEQADLLNYANEIADLCELGILSRDDITPQDFTLLRIICKVRKIEDSMQWNKLLSLS